ncbi:hypothetical protein ACVSQB_42960, partial [Bradyrhizobium elkanii]
VMKKSHAVLLQPGRASFISPLLRFGHGFGLVEIPTGACRSAVSCSAEMKITRMKLMGERRG